MSEACPACNGERIDEDFEHLQGACEACGFVIQGNVDQDPEIWVELADDRQNSPDEHWRSTCTVRNSTELQIADAFDELERLGEILHLTKEMKLRAAKIYCEAHLLRCTDGRDTTSLVAACIRLAAIQENAPVPAGRITELPSVSTSQFRLSDAAIRDEMGLELPPPAPDDFNSFLHEELQFGAEKMQEIEDLLQSLADVTPLAGKNPSGIAAAGCYVLLDDVTQHQVGEAVGVSTETIRKRVNDIHEVIADD